MCVLTTTKTIVENKVCKINISNNTTDDLGLFYNVIINDDATFAVIFSPSFVLKDIAAPA